MSLSAVKNTNAKVASVKGAAVSKKNPFVISVSSGKGGVGKTLTTINLALAAKRGGRDVTILDADLGLANVDVLLGLNAKHNIGDVLNGHVTMRDIVLEGPLGIKVVPSGSGIAKLSQLSYSQRVALLEHVEAIEDQPDILLVDTGAGISSNVLHFATAADCRVVVTTPEPHAITDAYAFIKVMCEEEKVRDFKLIVNMARSPDEGRRIAGRISDVARQFLDADVQYAGHVPIDPQVQRWVTLRAAAAQDMMHTVAGQAWNEIMAGLVSGIKVRAKGSNVFWHTVLAQSAHGTGAEIF